MSQPSALSVPASVALVPRPVGSKLLVGRADPYPNRLRLTTIGLVASGSELKKRPVNASYQRSAHVVEAGGIEKLPGVCRSNLRAKVGQVLLRARVGDGRAFR